MRRSRARHTRNSNNENMNSSANFTFTMLFLVIASALYIVLAFKPLTKDEQIDKINKIDNEVEPFRKNLTECARQVKASMADVDSFLKRVPQSSMQGKCFVACILKRNSIIRDNKIDAAALLAANKAVYEEDSEVISRLKSAIVECTAAVDGIFEICEYASIFNDCMHVKMEHILDKVTMERRMEALGQMTDQPDVWTDEDDEILKLVKDEL